MTFDPNNKTAFFYLDEHDIFLRQPPSWNPDDDGNEGDCIGRQLDCIIAWENDENLIAWGGAQRLVEAVKKCFVLKTDDKGRIYMEGYRHPNRLDDEYNDMSRDHTLYALIIMKYTNDPFLDVMMKYLRWRISDRFTFTPESWLWMKALKENRFYLFLFYLMAIPVMVVSVLWNKFIYKVAGFKEESHQDDFILVRNDEISEKKLKWRKLLYPTYAMLESAIMTDTLPKTIGNWMLKKVTLWGAPKHNYLMRLFLDGNVTREQVYGYKSMRGGRWSTTLNETNDRHVAIQTNPEYLAANVLDVDLVRAVYEKKNN